MTKHFDEISCNRLVISSKNGNGFISLDFDDNGVPHIYLHNENTSGTELGHIDLTFSDDGTPSLILRNKNAGGTETGHIHATFDDDGAPYLYIASVDHRGGTVRVGTDHDGSSIVLSSKDRYSNSNPPGIMITTDGNNSMISIEDEVLLEDRSTTQIDT